jgi:hypothetical protein
VESNVLYQSNNPIFAIEDFNPVSKLSNMYIKDNITEIKTAMISDYLVVMSNSFASE